LHALLLLERGGLENNSKLDLSMLRQKFELNVLNELLKVSWESLKHFIIDGHASSTLSE
jgi:hypothetical protein